jgi:UDP-2-acetamido-3-amino-2,3-dideoxy-glucuronate N-acetyltransferase
MKMREKTMPKPKLGIGVVVGKDVQFEENVAVWNYVVIGDNTKIGERTIMGSFVDIGKNVVVGKDCNIQAHVTISNGCIIGDNVFIAPNTSLLNDRYPKSELLTPVTVKNGAIIGGGVTILPNVIVGENAVVAGGSVVTKDVAANTVVMGVPARSTMSLKEYAAKRKAFISAQR